VSDSEENGKISVLDRYINLFSKVGFPAGIAVYLLYEFHIVGQRFLENQTLILETLRQLVSMHK